MRQGRKTHGLTKSLQRFSPAESSYEVFYQGDALELFFVSSSFPNLLFMF